MNEHKGLLTELGEAIDRYHAGRRAARWERERDPQQLNRMRRFLRWLAPNGGTLLLMAVLILTTNVWAKPLLSPASAPGPSATTVNYQGRLADRGGSPLSGTYGMTFSLYDAPTHGSPVWGPESHAAVVVSEGLFSVGLGSQTDGGIPTSVWDGDRYLEITVGGETLSPRELIRSVPIAGMALTLPDHTVDGDMLAASGFGTSSAPLRNFVIRGPVAAADLTDPAEVGEATWDLSPIVGDSAEMVVLHVKVTDDAENSFFQVWPNGEEKHTGVNTPYVRAFNASKSATGILWVRCDGEQTVKYTVHAAGGSELTELQVTVIGWVEPAAMP